MLVVIRAWIKKQQTQNRNSKRERERDREPIQQMKLKIHVMFVRGKTYREKGPLDRGVG